MNNVLKNGLTWFVAGALFAAAANVAAPLMAAGEIATLAAAINPVWLGTMMAGATMIATALEPVIHKIFGNNAAAKEAQAEKSETPQVNITIAQTPELSQNMAISSSKYQQGLQAERADADKAFVIG